MMQFLKLILSPFRKNKNSLEVRVLKLEKQIRDSNKVVSELAESIQILGDALHQISSELLIITHAIAQATSLQHDENDHYAWSFDDDDDDYLN